MALNKDHYVVAIGASAGGLEAIHEFFDHMSESANISFVIIQHLSSDYKSLLVELVSRHTSMKVFEAENGLVIQKNCIYVIPNNKHITLQKNKLLLEEKNNPHSPNNAIDTFLYSLAKDKANRAIAVILSGTGSDGTRGIEAIKSAGGMVIAQDPSSAKFDGMPNSAIHSGFVDQVVPPSLIPEEIMNYIRQPFIRQHPFSESDLEEIFRLIHHSVGFDFHYYKLPTITRRISRRMMQLKIDSVEEYLKLLRTDEEECRHLGNDFLIGVTRFFRDGAAYEILNHQAIERIVAAKTDHESIKVWVCACSTGEEAYSIAILINESISASGKNIHLKLFATDIDEAGIEIASKGIYPAGIIERDVDVSLLHKYFIKKDGNYHISSVIRKQIVFAKHDIVHDPPFINNDLVSCRNMLIYMNPQLQQKIFSLLMFSLSKHGYLFLGPSEHSTYIRENVEEVSNKWKIYRKIKDSRITSQHLPNIVARQPGTRDLRPRNSPSGHRPLPIWDAVKDAMNDDLEIAAFFIDRSCNIRESAGNYERFLELPKKNLQLNLLGMVPQELYFLLSSEIKKAWKSHSTSRLKNLKVQKNGAWFLWQILIKPMEPYTLVVITESESPAAPAPVHHHDSLNPRDDEYIADLQKELEELKINLDIAVEDLETTNEELQSSNEELLSANEELQSSNEELQSLNEELHTLNTEHQLKIKELIELNDDLNNYFRSTDIAQIFLDKNLNIRKFNQASAKMINFIDSDIGRPLVHISNNIQYDNFIQDVHHVLEKNGSVEREISLQNGRHLLMRIFPYLNRENQNNGIVITFVDITTLTQLNNTIRAVLNSSPGAILAFNAERQGKTITDFRLQLANEAAGSFLNINVEDLTGASLKRDFPALAVLPLYDQYVRVVETDILFHKDVFFEDRQKWFDLIVVKMMDGFVATFSDITSKKKAIQKLKKNYVELITVKDNMKLTNEQLEIKVRERTRALTFSEERFRLVARATNDALWDWDLVNNSVWWGETFYKMFGYEQQGETTDRNFWLSKVHPDERQRANDAIYEAINSGKSQWSLEYRFLRSDGSYSHILDRGYIMQNELGTPYRMLGSMFDVTDLKNAEQKLSTMNEQLEQKVTERTMELEQINDALEISNNDLQQFASVASHDLQEPLRKIEMFSKMVLESMHPEPDSPRKKYMEKIIISSSRMRSLVNDILNYSRLSSNDNNFEITDLNEVLRETLEDFELTIREKSAIIDVVELPRIEANSGQIRQVFHNLISNALKFSKAGIQPCLTVSCQRIAKKSFASPASENGPFYMLEIRDNGIGFDQEFANNIFNLFQRLHSKDKFEGTGIGLAITKKIIDKHNGLIQAQSVENEGTCFTIILPSKQTH